MVLISLVSIMPLSFSEPSPLTALAVRSLAASAMTLAFIPAAPSPLMLPLATPFTAAVNSALSKPALTSPAVDSLTTLPIPDAIEVADTPPLSSDPTALPAMAPGMASFFSAGRF